MSRSAQAPMMGVMAWARHWRQTLHEGVPRKDVYLAAGAVLAILGLAYGTWVAWGTSPVWMVLCVGVGLIVLLQLAVYRRVHERTRHNESVVAVMTTLSPVCPLPTFRASTIEPEVACLLVTTVFERRPSVVVECGSGVSTLVLAYSLKRLGYGRVVSLEHDKAYAKRTTALLKAHQVSDWAEVIHAPLVATRVSGSAWQWYDLAALPVTAPIDLLFVDGPPGHERSSARFPAAPLLLNRLASDATIIVDDANRRDERAMLRRWVNELGVMRVEHAVECRAVTLRRRNGAMR